MSIINKVFGGIGQAFRQLQGNTAQRGRVSPNGFFYQLNEPFLFNRETPQNLIQYGYQSNDIIYSVVAKIARVTGRLPRGLYVKAAQKGRDLKEVEQGELFDMLMRMPNPEQTPDQYVEEICINLMVTGICYIYKEPVAVGFNETHNWVIPTESVLPLWDGVPDIIKRPSRYQVNTGSRTLIIEAAEMMVIRYIDPSLFGKMNEYGQSPIQSGWTIAKASNNRNVAESSIFENRGASKLVSPKDSTTGMTPNDKQTMEHGMVDRVGGAYRFGRLIPISGAIDVHDISMSPNDLRLVEARNNHLRAICNLYGAASELFNDPDNKTYNNRKEASKEFYQNVIIPMMELIISAHEVNLIKKYEEAENKEYFWKVKIEDIEALNLSEQDKQDLILKQVQQGVISVNEARQKLGYDTLNEDEYNKPKATNNGNQATPNPTATQTN